MAAYAYFAGVDVRHRALKPKALACCTAPAARLRSSRAMPLLWRRRQQRRGVSSHWDKPRSRPARWRN